MNAYQERRTRHLRIAEETAGFDRVPSPERKDNPQMPYQKLVWGTNQLRVMSRQERRAQDAKEQKEPVFSKQLSQALGCMQQGDGLLIRKRASQRYDPRPTGTRWPRL